MPELSDTEVEEWKRRIYKMSHEELARLYRFAPSGDPLFVTGTELWECFRKRFIEELGGFTPEISKAIGW